MTAVIDALQLNDITLAAHDLGGPGRLPRCQSARRPLRGAGVRQLLCLAAQRARVPRHADPHGQRARPPHPTQSSDGFHDFTATAFGVGRHWSRADLATFHAGIDPAARRAWHSYFRDARAAHDLYTELHAGLPALLADRPLLTIFGQFNDPLRFQRRWRALNPNVRQVKVPRGNHFPMCDDPQLVASELKAFATHASLVSGRPPDGPGRPRSGHRDFRRTATARSRSG